MDSSPHSHLPASRSSPTSEELRVTWTTLYRKILTFLARSKSPSQPNWPVHLDHCFARIILDAVVGNSAGSTSATPCPWTERLDKPAIKHMNSQQLEQCIALGQAIVEGTANLAELDEQSLTVRGKQKGKGVKRKAEEPPPKSMDKKMKTTKSKIQPDIRTAMGLPLTPPKSPARLSSPSQAAPAQIDEALSSKIDSNPSLTPFRRRVLLALCQVPTGQFTTYLAISNFLHSSPRAVGNALRNNPFAPEVPCHRVVAADGGIGGFGGEWGVKGVHNGKKVKLLRGEGVRVEVGDGRVGGMAWTGFIEDAGQAEIVRG